MRARRHRTAFTLIELMVVVAIIALLVAIVLPAVNAARIHAKVTKTEALISSTLATGIASYFDDKVIGGDYPPSMSPAASMVRSPHVDNQTIRPQGAYLLAWALVGADFLGSPGFRDLDGNGTWADNSYGGAPGDYGLYTINTNQPDKRRSTITVEKEKLSFPDVNPSASGPLDVFVIDSLDTKPKLASICFLDAFDQPILYYRANPAEAAMVGQNPVNKRGKYIHFDNALLTGTSGMAGIDLGAGNQHPLRDLGVFGEFLRDRKATTTDQPQRPDSYILLSAGPDALYGTADDIANFEINK